MALNQAKPYPRKALPRLRNLRRTIRPLPRFKLHLNIHSLHVQMITAIVGVLTLGLLALWIMAGIQISQMMTDAFISERRVAAAVLASSSAEQIEHWKEGTQSGLKQVQDKIIQEANKLHLNISLLSPEGDLIAASKNAAKNYFEDSPEFVAALRDKIGSDIRDNRLYIAAPIPAENAMTGSAVSAIVWIDASLTPLRNSLWTRWLVLAGTALVVLVCTGLVGWRLSVRIVRPVDMMRSAAEQMATGKLSVRASIPTNASELAALGQAFNHMAACIGEMLEKQRDFNANASHELRSPLATIKLRAEALTMGDVDEQRSRQYALDINEEVTRLGALVSDLLQLSHINRYTFVPPTEPLNINDELRLSLKIVDPRIGLRHQQFQLHVQNDLPDFYIHARDLHIMVDNLLDNAVKYTPDGGKITLVTYWTGTTLVIDVSDTGIGIPPSDLPHISERFFRVDRAHTRHIAGTGLGLALVAATARQYDGKLTVHSTGIPGQGTQIHLFLHPAMARYPIA